PDALEAAPHVPVVLQNPGTFAFRVSRPDAFPPQVEDEQRVQSLVSVPGLDAEREYARRIDAAAVPEKLEQPEREQPPVHVAQRLIVVRQTEREAHRFPAELRNRAQVRMDDGLELLREEADLPLRHRNETPVPFPRAVVDVLDGRDLGVE